MICIKNINLFQVLEKCNYKFKEKENIVVFDKSENKSSQKKKRKSKIQDENKTSRVVMKISGTYFILPRKTAKKCWGHHRQFSTDVIGCPLVFYRFEDLSDFEKENFRRNLEMLNIPIPENFFECEGYFCSYPCVKLYINQQRNNPKYKDSDQLLKLMYFYIEGKEIDNINPSLDWRLLEEYGGDMSIEKFLEESVNTSYYEVLSKKTLLLMRPLIFEKILQN